MLNQLLPKIFPFKENKALKAEIECLGQELIKVTEEADRTCMALRAKYAPLSTGEMLEKKEKNELRWEIQTLKKALAIEVKKVADSNESIMSQRITIEKLEAWNNELEEKIQSLTKQKKAKSSKHTKREK